MCFMDTLLYNFILTSTMNILWKVSIFISPDCEVNNTVRFCVLHSLECSAVIAAGHVRRSRIASRLSVRPLASSVHQQQQQHWEMSDERCMVRAHQQTVSCWQPRLSRSTGSHLSIILTTWSLIRHWIILDLTNPAGGFCYPPHNLYTSRIQTIRYTCTVRILTCG